VRVDFEIMNRDGQVRASGSLPVLVMEEIQAAKTFDCMGVVYEIPAQHITQVQFGEKLLPITDGETLTLFYHHGKLDGSAVGNGDGQSVSGDEDTPPTILPIRPDVRSNIESSAVHSERPLREVHESVHSTPHDDPSEGEARRGGY
jgi:hypothetical protein